MSTLRADKLESLDGKQWSPSQSVDSVDALRAATFGSEVREMWLSGYYGVGTAGGGPLYRDSGDTVSADNGGTVFVDGDGVRWKRPESRVRSVTEFGATPGSSDDATLAINGALSSGSEVVFQPPGAYQCLSDVYVNNSVTWQAEGAQIEFGTGASLRVEGGINELGAIFLLAASEGDQEIEVAHAGVIQPGDVLMLFNTNDFSYSNYRTSYRDGEVVSVVAVNGDTITLSASLETSYAADTEHTVSILECIQVEINGVSLKGDASNGFKYTADSQFTNIKVDVSGNSSYGIISQFSYNDTYTRCRVNNVDVDANGYSIALAGAWYTTLNQCQLYSRRHAISVGNAGVTPVNRHLRFNDCSFTSYGNVNNTHAADLHGIVDDARFENCTAFGGVVLGGSNSSWRGGKIISNKAQGPLYIREVSYGTLEYSGADVINHSDGPDFGAHSSIEHDKPVGDILYRISNLRIGRTDFSNTSELIALPFGEVAGLYLSLVLQDVEYDYDISTYVSAYSRHSIPDTKVGELKIEGVGEREPLASEHYNNGISSRLESGTSLLTLPTQTVLTTASVPVGGVGDFGPVFPTRYLDWPYVQLQHSIVGSVPGSNLQVNSKGLSTDASNRGYFTTGYVADIDSTLSATTGIDILTSAVVKDVTYFG